MQELILTLDGAVQQFVIQNIQLPLEVYYGGL